jgi:hypothetical protein
MPYSVADPAMLSNLYDDAILILCATSAPDNTGQGENPLKSPCPEPSCRFARAQWKRKGHPAICERIQ